MTKQDQELRAMIAQGGKTNNLETFRMVGGFAVAALGWYVASFPGVLCVLGLILIVGGAGYGGHAMLRRRKAREAMKQRLSETLIPELLSQVLEDVEYDHGGHIDGRLIQSVGMPFPFEFDEVLGSDHIRGRYRGVDVEFSDITLDRVTETTSTDENGNSETKEIRRTHFRGQWIILDLHRELSADLSIFEGGRKKKGQVETENEAFNEKFGITCENEHDAFYILTPHLMDHIMTLDERAGGNTYMRFLKDGKVHVAVSSGRDHFELEMLNIANVDALRSRFRGELAYVTALVDELLAVDTMFRE